MFDRFQAIELITPIETTGALNQKVQTGVTTTTVYAEISSITRQEFLAAGTLGLKPSFSATIYSFEYNGEPIVKVGSSYYSVYRTFNRIQDDKIELYLEQKEGTKYEPSPSSSTP